MVAARNPHTIQQLTNLREKALRLVDRQQTAGSYLLLSRLLEAVGLSRNELRLIGTTARSETDVVTTILDGKADAGLTIAAVVRRFRLDFVPLHCERYDLAIARRDSFEPSFQRLLAITRTPRFVEHAKKLGGYDAYGLGRVIYNAP